MECGTSPGEDLVPIRLVPHVPDQLVVRCIENIVQSDRLFNDTKTGAEVPSLDADHINDELAQLFAYHLQLSLLQEAQVGGTVDPFQDRISGRGAQSENTEMLLLEQM